MLTCIIFDTIQCSTIDENSQNHEFYFQYQFDWYVYANWTIWPDLDAYQNLKYRFDFEPEKIQVHCY